MNAEKFSFYIKNPAHLYQITYTELKSLVLQYPYCQNLRYLLLKKSILENHQELDQNLQLAATFSSDRTFLYQQIKAGESYVSEADSFVLKEDYLELKDLSPEGNPEEISAPTPEQQAPTMDNFEITGDAASDLIEKTYEEQEPSEDHQQQEPPPQDFDNLENIEEEEFIDITDEMEGLFDDEHLDDLEIVALKNEVEEETEKKEEDDEPEPTEAELEDEAISIEDLIRLDSLTPLERMEQSQSNEKARKKEENPEQESVSQETEKEEPAFDAIDALIEKTEQEDAPAPEVNQEISSDHTETETPSPSPKSTFGSWLKQMQNDEPDQEETFDNTERKKEKKKQAKKKKATAKSKKSATPKKKKAKKKGKTPEPVNEERPEKTKTVAEKSLKENTEIASETLANLLVRQENYKKAIKMYEKLSLIFPEKSSFFAEQIKKLKNL